MSVGVGAVAEPAKSALPSDAAERLVNQALRDPLSRGDPIRLAILLATADWCDPQAPISAGIRNTLQKRLGYEVPLVGGCMARLFCSVSGPSVIEHGLVLVLLCSSELYATVGHIPGPHGIPPRELRSKLQILSEKIAGQRRIGGSSTRFLLAFFPGFFLDKRGHRSYLDNDLYDELLAIFDPRLPIFGGSSADDLVPSRGYQFADNECLESGLVLAHIETDVAVGMTLEHGMQPVSSRRVRVDMLAREGDSGYDVSIFDGQPAAVFSRELARTTTFPLGRPLFALPCGDDYQVIMTMETPTDDAAPVRLNRRVRRGDSLYILNSSTRTGEDRFRAIRGAHRRTAAPIDDMALVFGLACSALFRHNESLGIAWQDKFREAVQQYPGVPMAGGLCAGEFGLDALNRRRSNNLSIAVCCFASSLIPEARNRDLQRQLVVAGGELAVCTSPKAVAEKALQIAMEHGATGGKICHVDYKLGRILGLREPYGYAARLPESPHNWPEVLKITNRVVPGPPDTVFAVPADLVASAMPVSPPGKVLEPYDAQTGSERNDILPIAVGTRHAIFVIDSRLSRYCEPKAREAGGIITQLVIPLVGTGNRVIATLQLSFPDLRELNREEFAIWLSFAQKIAVNLERAWEMWERGKASQLGEVAEAVLHEPVADEPWPRESRERFLHAIADLTGVQSLHIRTLVLGNERGRERFRMFAAIGPVAGLHALVRPSIPDRGGSCNTSALRVGPEYTNTLEETATRFAGLPETTTGGEPRDQKEFLEWARTIASTAVLPLAQPGYLNAIGALAIDDPLSYFFNERMSRIVEGAARVTSVILRTRRGEYYRELSNSLQRAAREWIAEPAPHESATSQTWLRGRLREACTIIGADWGAIFGRYPPVDRLVLHTAYNWFDPNQEGSAFYATGEGWIGGVAVAGREIETLKPGEAAAERQVFKYHSAILSPNERERQAEMPRIALRLASGPTLIGVAVFGFLPRNASNLDELDEADHGYLREFARLLTLRLVWMRRQEDHAAVEYLRGAVQKIATMLGTSGGAEPDGTGVMRVLCAACRAGRATFYRLRGGKLVHAWTSWNGATPFESDAAEAYEMRDACLDVVRGHPCVIESPQDPKLEAWPDRGDVRTLYAVRVLSQGNAASGILVLVNRTNTPDHPFEIFDNRETRTVEDAARLIGSYLGFRESVLDQRAAIGEMEAVSEKATQSVVAAMLAHDAKRPISSIRRAVEYLDKVKLTELERRKTHAEIIANCDHAIEVIRGAAAGQHPLSNSWRVSDIVTQTLRVVRTQIPSGVQLVVAPPIDARVRARLWDIVSTLVNVVTNAVEAIEGEGTIRISTHESHDGRRAYIQVENTGRVFTQDEADKFSEWGFTTKRGEHRGYGLQLAKEHVSALEGDVRVVAPPEGGIKVIVSLPIADTRTLEVTKS